MMPLGNQRPTWPMPKKVLKSTEHRGQCQGGGGSDVMVLQSKEGSHDYHVIGDKIPDGLSKGTKIPDHREQGVMQG